MHIKQRVTKLNKYCNIHEFVWHKEKILIVFELRWKSSFLFMNINQDRASLIELSTN